VVVEAMKMQNVLRSERDCTVKKVLIKPGEGVVVDQVLVEFE
jgi:propionyl-CoA carboxylase alpha chain